VYTLQWHKFQVVRLYCNCTQNLTITSLLTYDIDGTANNKQVNYNRL